MAANSNGQVTYLILESLSSGSKYGLEIIEHISTKTGGNYILKKPTLYSSLTRMEKKGFISSSYWGESELGGKRHYYSITAEGRKNLESLAKEFENTSFENDQPTQAATFQTPVGTEKPSTNEGKPVYLKQNNLFDLVNQENTPKQTEDKNDEPSIIENQMDIFSMPLQEEPAETKTSEEETSEQELKKSALAELLDKINQTEEETEELISKEEDDVTEEPLQDDGKFLESDEHLTLTPLQEEQNQRLYDTSAELKKYRKKKSFAENQIEMAVVYEKQEDAEIQKARIEQLKQSILNLKNPNASQKQVDIDELTQSTSTALETQMSEETQNTQTASLNNIWKESIPQTPPTNNTQEEKEDDDGVFVTDRMDVNDIPIQKKIMPTNIEVNIYDSNLPAPNRDTSLEPTYKDMMAKLFERKKEKEIQRKQEAEKEERIIEEDSKMESFADYNSLQKYYTLQGIEFKEYKKTPVSRRHNTNFLKFISASIMFLLSSITSAILFGILSGVKLLKTETNFMFYTIPIIFFVFGIVELIRYKTCISKKPRLLYNSIVNWAVFILGALVVFVINITCGMQYEHIPQYLTTLLLPIVAILIAFPINYYVKKFLFKKFGK